MIVGFLLAVVIYPPHEDYDFRSFTFHNRDAKEKTIFVLRLLGAAIIVIATILSASLPDIGNGKYTSSAVYEHFDEFKEYLIGSDIGGHPVLYRDGKYFNIYKNLDKKYLPTEGIKRYSTIEINPDNRRNLLVTIYIPESQFVRNPLE